MLFLFCFAELTASCIVASCTEAVMYHSVFSGTGLLLWLLVV
jgi:hypothetical protein